MPARRLISKSRKHVVVKRSSKDTDDHNDTSEAGSDGSDIEEIVEQKTKKKPAGKPIKRAVPAKAVKKQESLLDKPLSAGKTRYGKVPANITAGKNVGKQDSEDEDDATCSAEDSDDDDMDSVVADLVEQKPKAFKGPIPAKAVKSLESLLGKPQSAGKTRSGKIPGSKQDTKQDTSEDEATSAADSDDDMDSVVADLVEQKPKVVKRPVPMKAVKNLESFLGKPLSSGRTRSGKLPAREDPEVKNAKDTDTDDDDTSAADSDDAMDAVVSDIVSQKPKIVKPPVPAKAVKNQVSLLGAGKTRFAKAPASKIAGGKNAMQNINDHNATAATDDDMASMVADIVSQQPVLIKNQESLLGNPESGGKTRSAKDSVGNMAGGKNSKQDTDDDKATSVADNDDDDMASAVAGIVSQQLAKRPVPIKNQETLLGKPQSGRRARSGTVSAAKVAGGPVARGKVSESDKDEVMDSPENVVQKADKQLADKSTPPAKATIKNQEPKSLLGKPQNTGRKVTFANEAGGKAAGGKVPGGKVPGGKVPGGKVPAASVPTASVPAASAPTPKVPAVTVPKPPKPCTTISRDGTPRHLVQFIRPGWRQQMEVVIPARTINREDYESFPEQDAKFLKEWEAANPTPSWEEVAFGDFPAGDIEMVRQPNGYYKEV